MSLSITLLLINRSLIQVDFLITWKIAIYRVKYPKMFQKQTKVKKISVVEAVRSAGAFFKPTNLLKKNDNISNIK